jgi:hypothetical protein
MFTFMSSKSTRFTGNDYLTSLAYSTGVNDAGKVLWAQQVNPQIMPSGPLQVESQLWSIFKVVSMAVDFTSAEGGMSSGEIILFHDPDPASTYNAGDMVSLPMVMSKMCSVKFPVRQNKATLQVDCCNSNDLFVKRGFGEDPSRLTNFGTIVAVVVTSVNTSGDANSAPDLGIGTLNVRYDFLFKGRQVELLSGTSAYDIYEWDNSVIGNFAEPFKTILAVNGRPYKLDDRGSACGLSLLDDRHMLLSGLMPSRTYAIWAICHASGLSEGWEGTGPFPEVTRGESVGTGNTFTAGSDLTGTIMKWLWVVMATPTTDGYIEVRMEFGTGDDTPENDLNQMRVVVTMMDVDDTWEWYDFGEHPPMTTKHRSVFRPATKSRAPHVPSGVDGVAAKAETPKAVPRKGDAGKKLPTRA